MTYPVKLIILQGKSQREFTFDSEKLKQLGGLPSGKVMGFIMTGLPDGNHKVAIRPYYRRFKAGELNIFAIQIPEPKA